MTKKSNTTKTQIYRDIRQALKDVWRGKREYHKPIESSKGLVHSIQISDNKRKVVIYLDLKTESNGNL